MWRASSWRRTAIRSAIAWIEEVAAAAMTTALRARVTGAPVRETYEPPSRFSAWTARRRARTVTGVGRVVACVVGLALCAAAPARAADCPNAGAVKVPGAEMQKSACLDDLTTAGTAA